MTALACVVGVAVYLGFVLFVARSIGFCMGKDAAE